MKMDECEKRVNSLDGLYNHWNPDSTYYNRDNPKLRAGKKKGGPINA